MGEHSIAVFDVLQAHAGGVHDLVFALQIVAYYEMAIFRKYLNGEWFVGADDVVFDAVFKEHLQRERYDGGIAFFI